MVEERLAVNDFDRVRVGDSVSVYVDVTDLVDVDEGVGL
jgi:hypothetical protein